MITNTKTASKILQLGRQNKQNPQLTKTNSQTHQPIPQKSPTPNNDTPQYPRNYGNIPQKSPQHHPKKPKTQNNKSYEIAISASQKPGESFVSNTNLIHNKEIFNIAYIPAHIKTRNNLANSAQFSKKQPQYQTSTVHFSTSLPFPSNIQQNQTTNLENQNYKLIEINMNIINKFKQVMKMIIANLENIRKLMNEVRYADAFLTVYNTLRMIKKVDIDQINNYLCATDNIYMKNQLNKNQDKIGNNQSMTSSLCENFQPNLTPQRKISQNAQQPAFCSFQDYIETSVNYQTMDNSSLRKIPGMNQISNIQGGVKSFNPHQKNSQNTYDKDINQPKFGKKLSEILFNKDSVMKIDNEEIYRFLYIQAEEIEKNCQQNY